MQCPFCSGDSRVLDSRGSGDSVRRRRECEECERRFTTYETFRLELRVDKRDGRSENFDRDKLLRVVDRLTRDRSTTRKAREDLVRGLETELADSGASVVTSSSLAERLYRRLVELDRVAAQRFATNYQIDDGAIRFSRDVDSSQLSLPVVAEPALDPPEPAPPDPPRPRRRKSGS